MTVNATDGTMTHSAHETEGVRHSQSSTELCGAQDTLPLLFSSVKTGGWITKHD